jgi:hypothetical protein
MREISTLLLIGIMVMSCNMFHKVHEVQIVAVQPSQSWDQENLKRNDKGCPNAIYIAPNGKLEQC